MILWQVVSQSVRWCSLLFT